MNCRNRYVRIVAALLCICLLVSLAACGQSAKPRQGDVEIAETSARLYTETEIELPDGINGMDGPFRYMDGSLLFTTWTEDGRKFIRTSDFGKTWEDFDGPVVDFFIEGDSEDSERYPQSFAYDTEGNCYILYTEASNYNEYHLGKISLNGDFEELLLDWKYYKNDVLTDVVWPEPVEYDWEDEVPIDDIDDDANENDDDSDDRDDPDAVEAPVADGARANPTTAGSGDDDAEADATAGNVTVSGPKAADAEDEDTDASGDDEAEEDELEDSVSSSRIMIEDEDYFDFYPDSITIGPGGDIFIGISWSAIFRYGQDGSFKEAYGNRINRSIIKDDALIYFSDEDEGGTLLTRQNLTTGEIEAQYSYTWDEMSNNALYNANLSIGADGDLYVLTEKGFYKMDDNLELELIMDGTMSILNSSRTWVQFFFVEDRETFYMGYWLESGYEIKQLTYTPDKVVEITSSLRIFSLEDNYVVREAAIQYQRNHPEVEISMEVIITGDNTITASDAIRTLNTQLLAGDGPDLFVLDGLPYASYLEKGVLADITSIPDTMTGDDALVMDIVNGMKIDGKLYALPLSFTIPAMMGMPDQLAKADSLEALLDITKEYPDKSIMYNVLPDILLRGFYPTYASSLMDSDGSLNEEAFINYITTIQSIMEESPAPETGEYSFLDYIDEEYYDFVRYYDYLGNERSNNILHGTQYLSDINLYDESEMIYNYGFILKLKQEDDPSAKTLTAEDVKAYLRLLPGPDEGVFVPKNLMGINKSTAEMEHATGIIAETLSYSFNKAMGRMGNGFPLNAKVLSYQFGEPDPDIDYGEYGRGTWGFYIGDNVEIEVDLDTIPDSYYKAMYDLVTSATTAHIMDVDIVEMMRTETKPFFEGTISAEEAADALAKKLQIYKAS